MQIGQEVGGQLDARQDLSRMPEIHILHNNSLKVRSVFPPLEMRGGDAQKRAVDCCRQKRVIVLFGFKICHSAVSTDHQQTDVLIVALICAIS